MVTKPRMKPKFTIPLTGNGEQVFQHLVPLLNAEDSPVKGQVLKEHAYIQFPKENRSLLSPYLNLTLHKKDGGEFELVGRFSPHPHVWTGFMAIYGVIGMIGLSGLVFGWARHLIGESAILMWAAPLSLCIIAFVYGAAVIGQGLTADQMYVLRRVVDKAVDNCESITGITLESTPNRGD
jgi:hypothetical protein